GRERKRPTEDREGAKKARLSGDEEERLKDGWELRRERKKARGACSDDTEIRRELKDLGYDSAEITAIIRTKALRAAAIWLVASRIGKAPSTIRKQADSRAR